MEDVFVDPDAASAFGGSAVNAAALTAKWEPTIAVPLSVVKGLQQQLLESGAQLVDGGAVPCSLVGPLRSMVNKLTALAETASVQVLDGRTEISVEGNVEDSEPQRGSLVLTTSPPLAQDPLAVYAREALLAPSDADDDESVACAVRGWVSWACRNVDQRHARKRSREGDGATSSQKGNACASGNSAEQKAKWQEDDECHPVGAASNDRDESEAQGGLPLPHDEWVELLTSLVMHERQRLLYPSSHQPVRVEPAGNAFHNTQDHHQRTVLPVDDALLKHHLRAVTDTLKTASARGKRLVHSVSSTEVGKQLAHHAKVAGDAASTKEDASFIPLLDAVRQQSETLVVSRDAFAAAQQRFHEAFYEARLALEDSMHAAVAVGEEERVLLRLVEAAATETNAVSEVRQLLHKATKHIAEQRRGFARTGSEPQASH